MPRIVLDGEDLALEQVRQVAHRRASVSLGAAAAQRMESSRSVVLAALSKDQAAYGVNTGFGHLVDVRIAPGRIQQLQSNLLRSHAAGVGEPLGPEETRTVMLLRASTLSRGHSGVRPVLVRRLLMMINADLLPRIPSQGSVGASGDLAPLAHLALTLIGEGEIARGGGGGFVPASDALRSAKLHPLRLEAKEGLSLINGTQMTTAIGVLALLEAEALLTQFDIAGAMSLEALKGSARPFDERIQKVRPHPGQAASARNLRLLLADSEIMDSHRDCGRVQDSYALRCMPQVHGAGRDATAHVRRTLEIEVNAATDNPLVFVAPTRRKKGASIHPAAGGRASLDPGGEMISGGNFHAQPIAAVLDYLALSMTAVASISERRIERLVNPNLSGLPAFLSDEPGFNSGLMMAQVTAAALVSENKVLSHPASVDSIPTSANREDHVPMAPIAARKAQQIVRNTRRVLAIEMLAAAQALDFLAPLRPAKAVRAVHEKIRRKLRHMDRDRVIAADIGVIEEMVMSGALCAAAESETGELE